MELTEFSSDSKLSIMNALTWVVSAVIHGFEAILDTFAVDISTTINQRINGTPVYYANALLKYQQGDILQVREDGLAFGYESVDETKQIITQVSYSESSSEVNLDNKLILKVATGSKGKLSAIPAQELVMINAYIHKIKFAGTRIEVTSLEGDVLIPRVSVFYDGAVLESQLYDAIEESLNSYIMNIDFDSGIYISKVFEAIRSVDHVTDVYIDTDAIPEQGVFLAHYNSDGIISQPQKIIRMTHTHSGYIKQSTGKDQEQSLPGFKQAIKLIIDNGCDTNCLQTD